MVSCRIVLFDLVVGMKFLSKAHSKPTDSVIKSKNSLIKLQQLNMFLRPRLAYRQSSVAKRRTTLRHKDDDAKIAMMVLRPRDAYRHQSPKKRRVRKTLVHDLKQRLAKKRALTMIKTWTTTSLPMYSTAAFIKSEPRL